LDEAQRKFAKLSDYALPADAGSALAGCLRFQLSRARDSDGAPVRLGQSLAPTTIARIAIDMLDTYVLFDRPPAHELVQLIRELLDVDKKKLKSSRQHTARYNASWILAQDPSIKTRHLARYLGVEPSSISRWRRDPEFNAAVQRNRETIKVLERQGVWPPKESETAVTRGELSQGLKGLIERLKVLETQGLWPPRESQDAVGSGEFEQNLKRLVEAREQLDLTKPLLDDLPETEKKQLQEALDAINELVEVAKRVISPDI
jgi:hypothetical protein